MMKSEELLDISAHLLQEAKISEPDCVDQLLASDPSTGLYWTDLLSGNETMELRSIPNDHKRHRASGVGG